MGDGYLRPVSEHVDGAEEGFAAAVGLGQNPFCHSAAVYASTGQVQPGSVEGGGGGASWIRFYVPNSLQSCGRLLSLSPLSDHFQLLHLTPKPVTRGCPRLGLPGVSPQQLLQLRLWDGPHLPHALHLQLCLHLLPQLAAQLLADVRGTGGWGGKG